MLQVTLLANGRLMYTGPPDQLVNWFTSLGYRYNLTSHGMASDWALDLVALGFAKPHHDPSHDVAAGGSTAVTEQQEQQQGSLRYRGPGGSVPLQQQVQLERKPSMMSSKLELFDAAEAFLEKLQQEHPEWFKMVAGSAASASAGVNGASASSSSSPAVQVGTSRAAVAPAPAGTPGSPETWWAGNTAPRLRGDNHVTMQQQPGQQQPAGWWRRPSADAGDDAAVDQDIEQHQQQELPQPGQHQDRLEAAIVKVTDAGRLLEEAGPFAHQQQRGVIVVEQQQQQSVWSRCMSALHKYRALLWRELLITTRWVASAMLCAHTYRAVLPSDGVKINNFGQFMYVYRLIYDVLV